MIKAYVIYASTGCTCCANENHYRGIYRTKEDAQNRINHYKHPDSTYWPLASQYSRRGNYSIEEVELEEISGNRAIIFGDSVIPLDFIVVKENGTIEGRDGQEKLYL